MPNACKRCRDGRVRQPTLPPVHAQSSSCLLSSAWVRLRTNAVCTFFGGSMIFCCLRPPLEAGTPGVEGLATELAMEGNGRKGREVGNI